MIGHIRGKVLTREPDKVLVEAAGTGVGYEIRVSARTLVELPGPGEDVQLAIHTQVREDDITLYGFIAAIDRTVFRVLQTVSGIGPKLALAIVGTTEPMALCTAIMREDLVALTRIPGLGKKTAARLVLELKDKLPKLLGTPIEGLPEGATPLVLEEAEAVAVADATAALAALGYSAKEIAKTMKRVDPQPDEGVQEVLRRALKLLCPA